MIACEVKQKVLFVTHMLASEVGHWWENTWSRLEGAGGAAVPWDTFRHAFLEKYFLEDIKNKKEIEFLELKQGGMTVVEYVVKFKGLVHYYPHCQGEAGEQSKCVKFLNGLRPEIKLAVNYLGIHNFAQLTNMCHIYDEDQ